MKDIFNPLKKIKVYPDDNGSIRILLKRYFNNRATFSMNKSGLHLVLDFLRTLIRQLAAISRLVGDMKSTEYGRPFDIIIYMLQIFEGLRISLSGRANIGSKHLFSFDITKKAMKETIDDLKIVQDIEIQFYKFIRSQFCKEDETIHDFVMKMLHLKGNDFKLMLNVARLWLGQTLDEYIYNVLTDIKIGDAQPSEYYMEMYHTMFSLYTVLGQIQVWTVENENEEINDETREKIKVVGDFLKGFDEREKLHQTYGYRGNVNVDFSEFVQQYKFFVHMTDENISLEMLKKLLLDVTRLKTLYTLALESGEYAKLKVTDIGDPIHELTEALVNIGITIEDLRKYILKYMKSQQDKDKTLEEQEMLRLRKLLELIYFSDCRVTKIAYEHFKGRLDGDNATILFEETFDKSDHFDVNIDIFQRVISMYLWQLSSYSPDKNKKIVTEMNQSLGKINRLLVDERAKFYKANKNKPLEYNLQLKQSIQAFVDEFQASLNKFVRDNVQLLKKLRRGKRQQTSGGGGKTAGSGGSGGGGDDDDDDDENKDNNDDNKNDNDDDDKKKKDLADLQQLSSSNQQAQDAAKQHFPPFNVADKLQPKLYTQQELDENAKRQKRFENDLYGPNELRIIEEFKALNADRPEVLLEMRNWPVKRIRRELDMQKSTIEKEQLLVKTTCKKKNEPVAVNAATLATAVAAAAAANKLDEERERERRNVLLNDVTKQSAMTSVATQAITLDNKKSDMVNSILAVCKASDAAALVTAADASKHYDELAAKMGQFEGDAKREADEMIELTALVAAFMSVIEKLCKGSGSKQPTVNMKVIGELDKIVAINSNEISMKNHVIEVAKDIIRKEMDRQCGGNVVDTLHMHRVLGHVNQLTNDTLNAAADKYVQLSINDARNLSYKHIANINQSVAVRENIESILTATLDNNNTLRDMLKTVFIDAVNSGFQAINRMPSISPVYKLSLSDLLTLDDMKNLYEAFARRKPKIFDKINQRVSTYIEKCKKNELKKIEPKERMEDVADEILGVDNKIKMDVWIKLNMLTEYRRLEKEHSSSFEKTLVHLIRLITSIEPYFTKYNKTKLYTDFDLYYDAFLDKQQDVYSAIQEVIIRIRSCRSGGGVDPQMEANYRKIVFREMFALEAIRCSLVKEYPRTYLKLKSGEIDTAISSTELVREEILPKEKLQDNLMKMYQILTKNHYLKKMQLYLKTWFFPLQKCEERLFDNFRSEFQRLVDLTEEIVKFDSNEMNRIRRKVLEVDEMRESLVRR